MVQYIDKAKVEAMIKQRIYDMQSFLDTLEVKDVDNSDPKLINDNIPCKESEVICVNCSYRWIAERPVTKHLKDIECPWCGKQGFVIETGETIKQIKR